MDIVDRMLQEARQLHERATGEPYSRERLRGRPLDLPKGLEPEGYLYQQLAHLRNLLAARTSPFWSSTPGWMPVLDAYETADRLVIRLELPGLKREEVTLSIGENLVVVKGERTFRADEPGATVLARERFYGPFERWIPLPCRVRPEESEAVVRDGVLEVRLVRAVAGDDATHRVPIN